MMLLCEDGMEMGEGKWLSGKERDRKGLKQSEKWQEFQVRYGALWH